MQKLQKFLPFLKPKKTPNAAEIKYLSDLDDKIKQYNLSDSLRQEIDNVFEYCFFHKNSREIIDRASSTLVFDRILRFFEKKNDEAAAMITIICVQLWIARGHIKSTTNKEAMLEITSDGADFLRDKNPRMPTFYVFMVKVLERPISKIVWTISLVSGIIGIITWVFPSH